MRVAILDYGAGNLHSLTKAVARPGRVVSVQSDVASALKSDALILPGVGAFALAAGFIAPKLDEIHDAVKSGLPCLGICLGMQLLFDGSEEGEGHGIGVIPGNVRRLRATRVPQIGWNDIDDRRGDLFAASALDIAYFANSFVCEPHDESSVTAWATHEGDRFPASVQQGNIVGVQFHPEKSSAPGVAFIDAFLSGIEQ